MIIHRPFSWLNWLLTYLDFGKSLWLCPCKLNNLKNNNKKWPLSQSGPRNLLEYTLPTCYVLQNWTHGILQDLVDLQSTSESLQKTRALAFLPFLTTCFLLFCTRRETRVEQCLVMFLSKVWLIPIKVIVNNDVTVIRGPGKKRKATVNHPVPINYWDFRETSPRVRDLCNWAIYRISDSSPDIPPPS